MTEFRDKNSKFTASERNDKSKTPINLRSPQNRQDLTPTRLNLTNTPNSQLKAILKEQILKKNLADSKISAKSSKNFKIFPFTNKKLNLNFNPLYNQGYFYYHFYLIFYFFKT